MRTQGPNRVRHYGDYEHNLRRLPHEHRRRLPHTLNKEIADPLNIPRPSVDPERIKANFILRDLLRNHRSNMTPYLKCFGGMSDVDLANPLHVRSHMQALNMTPIQETPVFGGAVELLEDFLEDMVIVTDCAMFATTSSRYGVYSSRDSILGSYSNFILGCCWIYICLKVGVVVLLPEDDHCFDRQIVNRVWSVIMMISLVHENIFTTSNINLKDVEAVDMNYDYQFPTPPNLMRHMGYCFTGIEAYLEEPVPEEPKTEEISGHTIIETRRRLGRVLPWE